LCDTSSQAQNGMGFRIKPGLYLGYLGALVSGDGIWGQQKNRVRKKPGQGQKKTVKKTGSGKNRVRKNRVREQLCLI
jgi:hypothetical protein